MSNTMTNAKQNTKPTPETLARQLQAPLTVIVQGRLLTLEVAGKKPRIFDHTTQQFSPLEASVLEFWGEVLEVEQQASGLGHWVHGPTLEGGAGWIRQAVGR